MYKFIVILIFAGSIFITSGKFIESQSTPKYYFVVLLTLAVVGVFAIGVKRIKLASNSSKETVFYGFYSICVLQALYGLSQFLGWLPSNHPIFKITGSFENPAGFAAVLSLAFPIGLFLSMKSRSITKYIIIFGSLLIASAVFLSESRSGMVAILTSLTFFIFFQTSTYKRITKFQFKILSYITSISLLVLLLIFLYNQKKDSANGRLLIWKISCEMIKDKPIFGHGYGSFKAKYMSYQASYFKENPNSKDYILADNVQNPFNEFILLTVELGLVGLFVFCLIIVFLLKKIKKSENENRYLALTGLISFLTFACFSYPLQFIAVWLLLIFYVSLIFPQKIVEFKKSTIFSTIKLFAFITACLYFTFILKQLKSELKWKEIVIKSLSGKTKEMLPEYEKLYPILNSNPFFLYNYGAELNIAGRYTESIGILLECKNQFNDYDLQLLLANNYQKKGDFLKAIQVLKDASNMIPCRFVPLYQLLTIYIKTEQKEKSEEIAKRIISKEVKINSSIIGYIKEEAKEYLDSISHSNRIQ